MVVVYRGSRRQFCSGSNCGHQGEYHAPCLGVRCLSPSWHLHLSPSKLPTTACR